MLLATSNHSYIMKLWISVHFCAIFRLLPIFVAYQVHTIYTTPINFSNWGGFPREVLPFLQVTLFVFRWLAVECGFAFHLLSWISVQLSFTSNLERRGQPFHRLLGLPFFFGRIVPSGHQASHGISVRFEYFAIFPMLSTLGPFHLGAK